MYTVIRRYTGQDLRPIIEKNADSLKETMSGIQGLRGYYLVQGSGNELASVTVCDNQACTKESNSRAAEWIKKFVPASANLSKPQVTEGETILEVSRQMATR